MPSAETRPPLYYIAMPYRGDVRANIAAALEVGRYFMAQGIHVVVPHIMSPDLDPHNRMGHDYWLAATANMLVGCTHIVLGPGWERSAGARDELLIAQSLGLEVVRMEEA